MARIKHAPTFANLTGSQLIAAMINTFLFGIAFIVTLQYFRRQSRKDPIYVKALIGAMIILATLQTIFVNHQSYRDTITKHNSDAGRAAIIEFTIPGKFACVFLITFIAQIFFATRIWILTENVARRARYAIIPIVALALLQLTPQFVVVAGSIVVHLEITNETFVDLGKHAFLNTRSTGMQGCATAACDLIITMTLCYLYHAHRSASAKVNSIIDRLVIYAINRAAATSICAMLNVFLFYFVRGTNYFTIPAMMTGQLYVISAVSVLISRESLREDVEKTLKKGDSLTKIEIDHDKEYTTSEKSV